MREQTQPDIDFGEHSCYVTPKPGTDGHHYEPCTLSVSGDSK